jgi:hypothetical protein
MALSTRTYLWRKSRAAYGLDLKTLLQLNQDA